MKKKCICRYEGCCYVPVKECPIHGDLAKDSLVKNWDKEFEREIYKFNRMLGFTGGIRVDLAQVFDKYLGRGHNKVKIKCKDGCIQIERIK